MLTQFLTDDQETVALTTRWYTPILSQGMINTGYLRELQFLPLHSAEDVQNCLTTSKSLWRRIFRIWAIKRNVNSSYVGISSVYGAYIYKALRLGKGTC